MLTAMTGTKDDASIIPPAIPTAPSFHPANKPPPPRSTFPSVNGSDTKDDLFAEPDIYVPGPSSAKKHDDDDVNVDNDDDQPADGNDSGGLNDSFANLAARFDSLKK